MGQSLIIVESPTKIRTIRKILGNKYDVRASMGHVRDLPRSKLGVDVEDNFRPHYNIIPGKKDAIDKIRKSAEKADRILLAPDPDREGEAISWHISTLLKGKEDRIYRVLFNEITRRGISEGMKNIGKIDIDKFNAQQARRILDRLVGYLVSPLLWKTLSRGLSAGRVQTVALRIICDREEEILAFVPEEFWIIAALLEGKSGVEFKAKYVGRNGVKEKIPDEKTTATLLEEIKRESFRIAKLETKRKEKYPYPPFITSTLQQEAHRRLNFSSSKTMRVAQQLYEGISIEGEGTTGLITYMRTDSTRISSEAIGHARKWIDANEPDLLPAHGRSFKSKKKIQDAHEGIRPTHVAIEPSKLKDDLTSDQMKLYEIIWRRFVACQMKPAVLDLTVADIQVGQFLFRAQGTVIRFPGYLRFTGEKAPEEKQGTLPLLEEGEHLTLNALESKQHFTKPPPRYTEATLIKALEEGGIGRPSTYAAIVSTLFLRKYVVKEKRSLVPTELGKAVTLLLVKIFPEVFNIKFTATMESDLDRVEAGEMDWREVLKTFYGPFSETLSKAQREKALIKKELQVSTDIRCEECGENMVIKWGKHGRFLACPNFPRCRNSKPLDTGGAEAVQAQSGETCDKCGSPMVVKSGRYGKFLACSSYPGCKNTKPFTLGIACPEDGCSGSIVERRTKKGKPFYGCSRYPDCRFVSWNKPLDVPCPHCGVKTTYLVQSRNNDEKNGKCAACNKRFPLGSTP